MTLATTLARTLRKVPTHAEKLLWRLLRDRRFAGYKFRRQHPAGPYVLDFYCAAAKLAVELDGDVHGTPARKSSDEVRGAYLTRQGIRVLRVWNVELVENQEGVMQLLFEELQGRRANPHPDPLPRKGEGS